MKNMWNLNKMFLKICYFVIFCLIIFYLGYPVFGHGPKGHEGMEFTALMALKKGVELYDRLVVSGKLTESWETDLDNLDVFKQINGNQEEFVVKFNRSKGEPKSVYIFFSKEGEYIGSNFTGE
jgi:hypothetical protein